MLDPKGILQEQEELRRQEEEIARKKNELNQTKREFESELVRRHVVSKKRLSKDIKDLEALISDTESGLELGLNIPEEIKNDTELYKRLVTLIPELGLNLEREIPVESITDKIDRYSIPDHIIRDVVLELKATKPSIYAEHVYNLLLGKGLIPTDRTQKRSLAIQIGQHLKKMHESGEFFESATSTIPRKYIFKKEDAITSEIQGQKTSEDISLVQDLSNLSNADLYERLDKSLPDIFTEDEAYKAIGSKIEQNRLTNILNQGYLVQRTNGGPLVFSRRHRGERKDRSEGDVFIIGSTRAKHDELAKLLEFYGVSSFTHIPYEDLDKGPTAIPDSIENARHIILFANAPTHKIKDIIKSKKSKDSKYLNIDNINSFRAYLSRNMNYFTE